MKEKEYQLSLEPLLPCIEGVSIWFRRYAYDKGAWWFLVIKAIVGRDRPASLQKRFRYTPASQMMINSGLQTGWNVPFLAIHSELEPVVYKLY